MQPGDLESLSIVERWQQAWQLLRKQGLAAPWRTHHQQVMASCSREGQSLAGQMLGRQIQR